MKNLTVKSKLTLEEYKNSNYPMLEAANFGYEHLVEKELARWGKYNPEVYVCEADPKLNYGLDFKVYLRYKADGITFFAEISYGSSCLSNGGFQKAHSVLFDASPELMEDFKKPETVKAWDENLGLKIWEICFSKEYYKNDYQAREFYRKANWTLSK